MTVLKLFSVKFIFFFCFRLNAFLCCNYIYVFYNGDGESLVQHGDTVIKRHSDK